MSTLNERDHLNPNDPTYYAPRWLRERSEQRISPSRETGSGPRRPVSSPPSFDALLEDTVSEGLRLPLDPEVIPEISGFVPELAGRIVFLRVAGRFAPAA